MRGAAITFTFLALVAGCGSRQVSSQQFTPRPVTQPEIEARQNFAWAKLPLTGNDTPYVKIVSEIDKAMQAGVTAKALRNRYGLEAQQKPDDPQAQFAWAYASWKALPADFTLSDKIQTLEGVPEALAHVRYPRSYQFARLRFLTEGPDARMWPLGETLLQRDPNDKEVKEHLVGVYQTVLLSSKPTDLSIPVLKRRAVSYAQQMTLMDPQKARYQANLATLYLMSWASRNNPEDGRAAIKYFQEYLRLAPADDGWRKQAEYFIKMIQEKQ